MIHKLHNPQNTMTTSSKTLFTGQRTLTDQLQELWRYRNLIANLVIRDLKVRYKNSILGVLWSLLNPLLLMVIFTFVFTIMQPNNQIPHFAVFILTGLLPWSFFSNAIMAGASQITGNGPLIKKVYFPREVLPISTVLSNFVNFLLSLIPLVLFLMWSGIGFTIQLIWLPVILMIHLIMIMGLALFLSALTVFYRDTIMILDALLLGLFFMTPIFYPMELIQQEAVIFGISLPINRIIRWLNPMASIVDSYRTVIYGVIVDPTGESIYYPPSPMAFDFIFRTGVTALLIFIVGWWFFRRTSARFGEEV